MLRMHFSDADLARTRIAAAPDPVWEIAASLHRLQSRKGRWAHAEWYRTARQQLREKGLERALRSVLLPLYPRAAYFPDFLTPADAVGDLAMGMESSWPRLRDGSWRKSPFSTAPSEPLPKPGN